MCETIENQFLLGPLKLLDIKNFILENGLNQLVANLIALL